MSREYNIIQSQKADLVGGRKSRVSTIRKYQENVNVWRQGKLEVFKCQRKIYGKVYISVVIRMIIQIFVVTLSSDIFCQLKITC